MSSTIVWNGCMKSPSVWGPSAFSSRLEVQLHWRLCRRSWCASDWREAYERQPSAVFLDGPASVTRQQSSAKYLGACPDNAWWTRVAMLNSTRCRTGSQCRWRSIGEKRVTVINAIRRSASGEKEAQILPCVVQLLWEIILNTFEWRQLNFVNYRCILSDFPVQWPIQK